jgi:outer membrane protein assembly factor BamB
VLNERLTSGSYTISVRATDGTNEARAFRDLQVQAAPLRLRSILVAPLPTGGAPYPVWRIDSTNALSTVGELTELGGAAIDPDRTYFSGTVTQPVQAWPNSNGQSIWTIPNQAPAGSTLPFFTSLCVDPGDGLCHVSMEDGRLEGRNSAGTVLFSGSTPVELRSRFTAVTGTRLVSLAQHRVLGTWHLVVHARPSGEVLARYPLDMEPIGLMARNSTEVVIIGSRNGTGILQLRNVEQGGGADISVFNEGPIAAFARSGPGGVFLAVQDRILRYSLSSSSPTVLAQGLSANAIAYSEASGAVYAAEGGNLWAIDPVTGSRAVLQTLPRPIGYILPLANR